MNRKDLRRSDLLNITIYLIVTTLIMVGIIYLYEFSYNLNTFMFIILVPIVVLPFFLFKDLMHPFNIFLVTSQLLFIFNMIDLNVNKDYFRYGNLTSDYHEQAFFWSILVIILWYLCMYIGYFLSKRMCIKKQSNISFKVNKVVTIAIVLIFIGLISYGQVLHLKGGFSGIIDSLSNRREAYAGLAYYIRLTGLISIGSIMLLSKGYKRTSAILIIVSFFMLASFGGRAGAFFGSIFPYLVYYHYRVKSLNIIKIIPIAFFGIIFGIGLGNYRLYQELRINFTSFYDIFSKIAMGTQGGEILPSLIGSLLKGEIEYKFGATIINIIFAPIPSSIWTNKPPIDETGIVGKELMGPEYWGLPPGPYGIAFFNFGFLGVIITGFAVGFIVYILYSKYVVNNNIDMNLIFYIFIIPSMFDILSTSSHITILWYVGVFLGIKILDLLLSSIMIQKRIIDNKL